MEKEDSESDYEDFEPVSSPAKWVTMSESLWLMVNEEVEKRL